MEDLTGEAHRAYWSAMAQVVPVLALALVLETRALARRWSQKKLKATRRARRRWVGVLLVFCFLLPWLITTALGNLAETSSRPWQFVLSLAAVTAIAFVVIGLPIASVVNTSWDVYYAIFIKMPWSKLRRDIKELEGVVESVELHNRYLRDRILTRLGDRADFLVSQRHAERWLPTFEFAAKHLKDPKERQVAIEFRDDQRRTIEIAEEGLVLVNDHLIYLRESQQAMADLDRKARKQIRRIRDGKVLTKSFRDARRQFAELAG
ncbi:hypothetical protein [Agromyces aerolatus]|uniref:hypothetical protein n=1 Tax=Agromyces sp. LY-1074 TaxID=3074080 RepID=UPI002862B529|nr:MULTISPECIES: hypothetical protein [unclassified Agromyces]MDR5699953.1 hypothetical protein [Agromyces sp. LY-1074]MDR5706235.1 hypothetical protein [Agromyces sp. LY-1358]